METKSKIIAFYLPQYHSIPENDLFWGKGFTDWTTVKNSRPLFKGHSQPRIPLNENYYDLSVKKNIKWQCQLAKEYGIYGFGIYHYWFNNEKNLLTKPAEIILESEDIDINYFYAWDNASWRRSWSNVKEGNDWAPIMENRKNMKNEPSILIPYIIGSESDWKNHYQYLLRFFKDSRYIKVNNKPMFSIIHYSPEIAQMCKCWDNWARDDGFDGMFFIFRYDIREKVSPGEFMYKYEPTYSGWASHSIYEEFLNKFKRKIRKKLGPRLLDYDVIWKKILKNAEKTSHPNVFHGCFVSYDDSPRRGKRGTIVIGEDPDKFKYYFSELLRISNKQKKNFIFITAWNEWGEGAYLEPDTMRGYKFLQVIKDVLFSM